MDENEIKLYFKYIPSKLKYELEILFQTWGYSLFFEGKCLDTRQSIFKKGET